MSNNKDYRPQNTMMTRSRIEEMLDYVTLYGEWSEETPNGTVSKICDRPMDDIRRAVILTYKRVLGIIPELVFSVNNPPSIYFAANPY